MTKRISSLLTWDAAIAHHCVGGTTGTHFALHLSAARAWVQRALAEARQAGIPDIPAKLGRPDSLLAKLFDEWRYLTVTRRKQIP